MVGRLDFGASVILNERPETLPRTSCLGRKFKFALDLARKPDILRPLERDLQTQNWAICRSKWSSYLRITRIQLVSEKT